MTPEDALFMELNANFNLKIYFMNPGDEIFAPINTWPLQPQEKHLTNDIQLMQIELNKETRISKKECIADEDYKYGGTH